MSAPTVIMHEGVAVVRDDLHPGGTKARYFASLFDDHDHVVYATPAEGGAQTALAMAARSAGKQCTIFTAKRKNPHKRTLAAKALGATVVLVPHGYLNVVQSKAKEYCRRTGAFELPFGGAVLDATDRIAAAAQATGLEPDEVWCAAGSGTLASGLIKAWRTSIFQLVQVGRELPSMNGQWATRMDVHGAGMPFEKASKADCPFPSDPHYDRKAWAIMKRSLLNNPRPDGHKVLFWNVTGPAEDLIDA